MIWIAVLAGIGLLVVAGFILVRPGTPTVEHEPPGSSDTAGSHEQYAIGTTVRVLGGHHGTMTGAVGTVVAFDPEQQKYLVRVNSALQNFFSVNEIERFTP